MPWSGDTTRDWIEPRTSPRWRRPERGLRRTHALARHHGPAWLPPRTARACTDLLWLARLLTPLRIPDDCRRPSTPTRLVPATPAPNYSSGPPADDPGALGSLEWPAASLPAEARVARGWDAV